MAGLEEVGVRFRVRDRQDFTREMEHAGEDLGHVERDAQALDTKLETLGRGFDGLADDALRSTQRIVRGTDTDFDRMARNADDAVDRVERDFANMDTRVSGSMGGMASRFDVWGANIFSELGGTAAELFMTAFNSGMEAAQVVALTSARLGGDPGQIGELAGGLVIDQVAEDVAGATAILVAVDENLAHLEDINDRQAGVLATGVGTLAAALGEDPQAIALGLGNFAEAFGIDFERALDLVSFAVTEGANRYGDLFETLQEYSVLWADLGLTADSAISTLVTASEGPAFQLAYVGDTLKEIGIRLETADAASVAALEQLGFSAADISTRVAAGGEDAREALEEVLVAIGDLEDAGARSQALAAIGGGPLENLGINEDTLALLNPIAGEIEGISEAIEGMTEATSGPGAEFSTMWDTIMTETGGGLADFADEVAGWSTDMAGSIAELAITWELTWAAIGGDVTDTASGIIDDLAAAADAVEDFLLGTERLAGPVMPKPGETASGAGDSVAYSSTFPYIDDTSAGPSPSPGSHGVTERDARRGETVIHTHVHVDGREVAETTARVAEAARQR